MCFLVSWGIEYRGPRHVPHKNLNESSSEEARLRHPPTRGGDFTPRNQVSTPRTKKFAINGILAMKSLFGLGKNQKPQQQQQQQGQRQGPVPPQYHGQARVPPGAGRAVPPPAYAQRPPVPAASRGPPPQRRPVQSAVPPNVLVVAIDFGMLRLPPCIPH